LKRVGIYFGGNYGTKYVLATLVFLMVADGILSQFLIKYGLGHEGNPLLQVLAEQPYFPLIKLAAVLLCVLILWDINKTRPRAAMATSLFFVSLYTVVLYWNLGVYLATFV
jgi:hypothetical protein